VFLRKLTIFIFLMLFFGLVSNSSAITVYNESISGDLSDNGLAPTSVTVAAGSNDIFGSTGRSAAGVVDRDYFTITVPGGLTLRSLIVLPGTTAAGGGSIAFISIQAGSQVTVPVAPADATGLLGFRHYGPLDINSDILPAIGTAGNGSTGFVPPLGAGSYSFWIQELSTGSFPYGFNLVITAVPEPAPVAMILAGLAVLATIRWRRAS
jgi:hypothetical protein